VREPVDFRDEHIDQGPTNLRTVRNDAEVDLDRPLTTSDMAGTRDSMDHRTEIQPTTRSIAERERLADGSGRVADSDGPAPLFQPDEAGAFRARWVSVQAAFVDDPHHAVEDADHLVAETIQRLAQMFADERSDLESQWGRSGDVSTEDLRLSLQKYRSFFERLLAA
jgi:hypothetical protein